MLKTYARFIALATGVAAALAFAYWGYVAHQKRQLQQTALELVQDSTARLGEALGLLTAGPEARRTLESSFTALEADVRRLASQDASLNPPLVRAAEAYITDVHAILRRQLAAHQARDAVRADMAEIAEHLRSDRGRSEDWIRQALALKQRLERNFFDYRFAAGGLEKSFKSLRDSRAGFEPFKLPVVVIEERALAKANEQLLAASARLTPEVENARKLPLPR